MWPLCNYVVNQCKSEFIYQVVGPKDVKGFALNRKFLQESVFPKYPSLQDSLQDVMSKQAFESYTHNILKPINEERKVKIQQINKKSVYREFRVWIWVQERIWRKDCLKADQSSKRSRKSDSDQENGSARCLHESVRKFVRNRRRNWQSEHSPCRGSRKMH